MKICFLITAFERYELLQKSIQSILDNWQDCFEIIVVDQSKGVPDKTFLKRLNVQQEYNINYYAIPFNSGLSYARNFGVQKAKELGCDYCLIGSDSFLFNSTIKWLDIIAKELNNFYYKKGFDRIGFELEGCICDWEAKLNLVEGKCFELDFINKDGSDFWSVFHPLHYRIYRCDIIRNFFLATTESLLKVKWDNNLKLCEHEDEAWRYKQAGYKVGWTDIISATKMTDRPNEYEKYRKQNFKEGQKYLRKKYNIKGWVTYKHLERAKHE